MKGNPTQTLAALLLTGLLGIAAAGYVGTDFIESFAPTISGKIPPVSSAKDKGAPHPEQIQPQSTSNHDFNSNWGVIFGSLIPNGFFSADPDDLRKSRSIRTNNPVVGGFQQENRHSSRGSLAASSRLALSARKSRVSARENDRKNLNQATEFKTAHYPLYPCCVDLMGGVLLKITGYAAYSSSSVRRETSSAESQASGA
jgi:hypothetical protein